MRGCGRIGRPAFPAPSDFEGRRIHANLGRIAPRECEFVFSVIASQRVAMTVLMSGLFEIRIVFRQPRARCALPPCGERASGVCRSRLVPAFVRTTLIDCNPLLRQLAGNEFCLHSANHKPSRIGGLPFSECVSCCVSRFWYPPFLCSLPPCSRAAGCCRAPIPASRSPIPRSSSLPCPGIPTCMSPSPTIRRWRRCGCRFPTALRPPISP